MTLRVFSTGRTAAHGAVIRELDAPRPPDALVVQGATATCADTNNDGIAGFAGAFLLLRDESGRGDIRGSLVPEGGDIGASGNYKGTIRFDDGSEPIPVNMVVRWLAIETADGSAR